MAPAAAVEPELAGWAEAAPNKSTIGAPADDAGGDDKNGFVNAALAAAPPLVGDETLDYKKEKNVRHKIYKNLIFQITKNSTKITQIYLYLILIHGGLFIG